MNMPDRVSIFHSEWEIKQINKRTMDKLSSEENSIGLTEYNEEVIYIREDIGESLKRTTLFHEILHACIEIGQGTLPPNNKDAYEWEHFFIKALEYTVIDVLRNNPEVIQYIIGGNE